MVTGVAPTLGAFLARRRAERLTAELDRAHDQYIALAGHELRTPLTTIQSYTDLLLDEAGLTEDQVHMLTAVQRNAAGLRAVVLKLLDVAALRAGRLDLQTERMDLVRTLREVATAGHAHPIRLDVPGTAVIDGDPVRLRQVADELIANAQVWAADDTAVDISLRTDRHTTVLSVSNTGIPIRPDEREYLFDPFYRGADARHHGIPGAGLGLSLARAVIDQHGGTISVSEPDDPVTTFTVRLPTNRQPARRAGVTA
jgi:signal transduction histidine kinase